MLQLEQAQIEGGVEQITALLHLGVGMESLMVLQHQRFLQGMLQMLRWQRRRWQRK